MKKLMIAAAIVCAAVMSQAAQVGWSSTYNYVTADGTVQTTATADAGQFVLCLLENGDWTKATVVNVGTVQYGSGKSGDYARAGGTYSFEYGATGAPKNGDIFGVMFRDGEGNLSQLVTTGGAVIDPTFEISGMSSDTYSGNLNFSPSSNYTVASVPEPTSALMLLLGVAGLALRRKQK